MSVCEFVKKEKKREKEKKRKREKKVIIMCKIDSNKYFIIRRVVKQRFKRNYKMYPLEMF